MLQEIKVSQKENDIFRRWFEDDFFELILWYDAGRTDILGFQLCYDKANNEHALTWRKDKGFVHNGIENGDAPLKYPSSPVLIKDGIFNAGGVLFEFAGSCALMDESISGFIIRKLIEYTSSLLSAREADDILAAVILKLSYRNAVPTVREGEGAETTPPQGIDLRTRQAEKRTGQDAVPAEKLPEEKIKEYQKRIKTAPAASEEARAERFKEVLRKAESFSKMLNKK